MAKMTMIRMMLPILALTVHPDAAWAQASDMPIPAASSDRFPPGIVVRQAGEHKVYADRHGHTLYGMDLRAVVGRTGRATLYCSQDCLTNWEPLLAPPGSEVQPTPHAFGGARSVDQQPVKAAGTDWTVMEGPKGPQWVYKRFHMVFTRKGDRPGSGEHDGEDGYIWNSLKYIPPVPELVAPPNVVPVLVKDAYGLADGQGNLLFSPKGKDCPAPCAWSGLAAGMARKGIGQWSVRQGGDQAQWVYRGKPVYRSTSANPADIPAEAAMLTP